MVIRYRLPAGSEPPLSDVVGHLLEAGRTLTVRTKAGDVVAVAADDVVVLRELPAATVRTADIRKLEHAAALAWPGVEQRWVEGGSCGPPADTPVAAIRLCRLGSTRPHRHCPTSSSGTPRVASRRGFRFPIGCSNSPMPLRIWKPS